MRSPSALATFALLVALSAAPFVSAQDGSGPWEPPSGSLAPSESRVPAGGSYGGPAPRPLDPIYQENGLPPISARPPGQRPLPPLDGQTSSARGFDAGRGHALALPPAEGSRLRVAGGALPVSHEEPAVIAGAAAEAAAVPGSDSAGEKRPLPPKPEAGDGPLKTAPGKFPFTATFGSLAVVLGAFFVFVWFQKRTGRRGAGGVPPEVVEPLGTIPFVSRQALHVVRFGGKILLINVTPGGSETLSEIDDPREAERILALCRKHRPDPLGRSFRELLGGSKTDGVAGNAATRSRGAAHA